MKNKPIRICPISNKPLPPKAHGNKIYHKEAKSEAKHRNNEKSYSRIRDVINRAKRLDDILAKHYPHSRETTAISKAIIDREGFAWDFTAANTVLANRTPVYWVLEYGYSFTDINFKSIIIHYGNNPILQSTPAPGIGEEN